MKTILERYPVYTGCAAMGFVYGLADASVSPGADLDALANRLGFAPPARVAQVHGDAVVTAAEAADGEIEADAVLAAAGEGAVIRVADCVPIVLIDAQRKQAAAVHAGWRGVYADIAVKAAARMGPADELYAWIGPSIGPCCYRIGDELAARFRERFGPGAWLVEKADGTYLDLQALAAHRLRQAGCRRIDIERRCTRDATDLHSFRRDADAAGRMGVFVFVYPTAPS
jgi:polyphenol oxidase